MTRWTVHGERDLYRSPWVALTLVDVEWPDGTRFEHHVVRSTGQAAGVVVVDAARANVLLLWRHRFITDTWGWEVPAGRIEADEDVADGAAREVLEETGWAPGPLAPLCRWHPQNGLTDQVFTAWWADGATEVGPPAHPEEADRVEWVPIPRVRAALEAGDVADGLTAQALTWALLFGPLAGSAA